MDVDFSSDWDDVMDVKTALTLDRFGDIDLLGIMVDTSNAWAPGAIEGMRVYYSVPNEFAIGSTKTPFDPQSPSAYTEVLYNDLSHPRVGLSADIPSAVSEYRRLLADRSGADVIILSTGPLNNLNDLLVSAADEYSPLSGADLMEASVSEVVILAGRWPNGTEWNMEQDPAAASNFLANCPVPIVFVGGEVGDPLIMGNGAVLTERPPTDPVRKARDLWNAAYAWNAPDAGRPGWAVAAFMYLTDPEWFTTTTGIGVVNASTGANTWTDDPAGPHRYVVKALADSVYIGKGNTHWVGTSLGQ